MKKIKLIIFTLVMLCGLTALAQKPNRIIIFNGYFFNELPAAVKNSGTPQDMKMFFIETPMKQRLSECILLLWNSPKNLCNMQYRLKV